MEKVSIYESISQHQSSTNQKAYPFFEEFMSIFIYGPENT